MKYFHRFLQFGGFLLLVYGGACAALFASQRSLLYFPQPRSISDPAATMVMPSDGVQIVVSTRPKTGNKALIYFGGNGEDVSASLASFSMAFPNHALYLLHYRGYGGSTGEPKETKLHADALALFDKVRSKHADIALIGRSLGSGVAIRLASQRAATRLILVTPYNSIEEIAAKRFPYFPVRSLLVDKFESWRHAPSIRVPTLLVQAEHDELIPAASTRRLHQQFAQGVASRVMIRATGHNTIDGSADYLATLGRVVNQTLP